MPAKSEPTPRRDDQRRRARFAVIDADRIDSMPSHLVKTYVNGNRHADADGNIRVDTASQARETGRHFTTIERHRSALVALGIWSHTARANPRKRLAAEYRVTRCMTPEERAAATAKRNAWSARIRQRAQAAAAARKARHARIAAGHMRSTGATPDALPSGSEGAARPAWRQASAAPPVLTVAKPPPVPATDDQRAQILARIRADLAASRH